MGGKIDLALPKQSLNNPLWQKFIQIHNINLYNSINNYTQMSQNTKTISLISCRSSVCCQNNDTLTTPWHGPYKTLEGIRYTMISGIKMLAADLSSPLGLRGRGRWIEIAGKDVHKCSVWLRSGIFQRAGQHLELFIMFHFKPFLNNVCSVAGCIILLKEATSNREHHCHEGVYLVWNNV